MKIKVLLLLFLIQITARPDNGKERFKKLQGIWIETHYLDCMLAHKSPRKCSDTIDGSHPVALRLDLRHVRNDTLLIEESSLHTHDRFEEFYCLEEQDNGSCVYPIKVYLNNEDSPLRYLTDQIMYLSDSTHPSFLRIETHGTDTLLVLERDSTDEEWKGRKLYKRIFKGSLTQSPSPVPIQYFLRKMIGGSYQLLNGRGKVLSPQVTITTDGHISGYDKLFKGKRVYLGTEFYCMPYPYFDYLALKKDTIEPLMKMSDDKWTRLYAPDYFGFRFHNSDLVLFEYQTKHYIEFVEKKPKYILRPLSPY